MNKRFVARFERVSRQEYAKSALPENYENIALPRRATSGSAGYDFFLPHGVKLSPGETVTVATGVRALIDDGWVLMIFPRSGLGFKYRLQLVNTVGIIDSDYSLSDNEGHIHIRMTNNSHEKTLELRAGSAFAQGVFLPYGLADGDSVSEVRNGGFGSTGI